MRPQVVIQRSVDQAAEVIGGVSGGVSTLLELLSAHPGLNAAELQARLNTPKRTVERWLKQLKDQQTIEFRGAPKTGGYHLKSIKGDRPQ